MKIGCPLVSLGDVLSLMQNRHRPPSHSYCISIIIILLVCVCVLYVTLSMRISVHNKSPELFTVKLESHSRRRVRHWALEHKVRDRYARRRFNSPRLPWYFPPPLFFPFLFSPLVFLPQFFSPFPSPLLKIFFPPQT